MHLLTGNDRPYVGDDLKYKTDVEVASYVADDGQRVTLVDTPGFDDSHEEVSDVDILERIAKFLQAEWVPFHILREPHVIRHPQRRSEAEWAHLHASDLRTPDGLHGKEEPRDI